MNDRTKCGVVVVREPDKPAERWACLEFLAPPFALRQKVEKESARPVELSQIE